MFCRTSLPTLCLTFKGFGVQQCLASVLVLAKSMISPGNSKVDQGTTSTTGEGGQVLGACHQRELLQLIASPELLAQVPRCGNALYRNTTAPFRSHSRS